MHTRILILAGGKGKRMKSEISKVLLPVGGRPILLRLLDAVMASGVDAHPAVVVGENEAAVREAVAKDEGNLAPHANDIVYVRQLDQLGTGHAVQSAEAALKGAGENVFVLYGDHPYVTPESITSLVAAHEKDKSILTIGTIKVEDETMWRTAFYDFGRIVRDAHGAIRAITERKDANAEELEIREMNSALYCFNAEWLWKNIHTLGNNNAQGEYYLTDLVRIAIEHGETVASFNINPLEAIGINTPDHLELAGKLAK